VLEERIYFMIIMEHIGTSKVKNGKKKYFRLPAFLGFCVIACRKWSFDGPMSHPMNPNRSLKTKFLKPKNLPLSTGAIEIDFLQPTSPQGSSRQHFSFRDYSCLCIWVHAPDMAKDRSMPLVS